MRPQRRRPGAYFINGALAHYPRNPPLRASSGKCSWDYFALVCDNASIFKKCIFNLGCVLKQLSQLVDNCNQEY